MNALILMGCLLGGYLLGSLNTSVIVSRMSGTDIRTKGSGNAGATNTLRVMGKKAAVLVLLCDILKAVLAVGIARAAVGAAFPQLKETAALLAGLGTILGHNFPLYFGFRGGKGVATSFGALLMLDWRVALLVLGVFILVILFSRYVSLSSCLAAAMLPVGAILFHKPWTDVLLYAAIGLLCILRHHENIRRLLSGTENKIGQKKEANQ